MQIRITGGEGIAAAAEALRRFGSNRTLVRSLQGKLRHAPSPIERSVKAHARQILPHSGGLAALVAGLPVRSVMKTSGDTVRLELSTSAGQIDAGRVSHPTYGHRPYVRQSVPPGFFSRPAAQKGQEELRRAGSAALSEVRVFGG